MVAENEAYSAFKLFFKIGSAYQRVFADLARSVNLTRQELSILIYIAVSDDEKSTPIELIQHLGIDKTQLSRSLRNLNKRAFVLKPKDIHNRKYIHIVLTPTGKEAIATVLASLKDVSWAELESLTPVEKAQIIQVLNVE
jgi:DNA-binding MarR family transcriptional regulator